MALTKTHLRFKQVRTELGLSQIEFSKLARIKQSQVSQIETGTRDISESIYQALELHFGANRAWIQTGEGDIFHPGHIPPSPIPPSPPKPRISAVSNVDHHILGQRLRAFRESLQISGKQLGSEFGIENSTINKYENGRLEIPLEAIVYLHDKYHMNYDWFFHGTGERKRNYAQRNLPGLTLEHLYDTQTLLLARIEYLDKTLRAERNNRIRQQKEINKISLSKS